MDRRVFIGSAAVAVAGLGSWYLTSRGGSDDDLLFGAANAQEADVDTSGILEMAKGDPEAAVTIIEYASYTCPHCRNFHESLMPRLQADYIDTGLVRFIYREVYFDRPGLWASMVARCGGEAKFFGITDLIYEGQSEIFSGEGADIAANLRRVGLVAGLDEAELDACMADAEFAQALVGWYNQNRDADDVQSTPTFLINGEKLDGRWDGDLIPAIDAALEGA